MHRAHRCTLADTVWAPTSANRTPALRRRPLPGRPPCRVTIPACPTRPTIPRAPRPRIRPTARAQPCAHCTSIAYALLPSSASPPPSLSSRCGGPRALAGKNRAVCIPFSPNARKRPPSWQHPPEMHAFRDQNGNILAPCIHSRVQSGDSGYMARESCRQGPFFASRNPKSRMARRCCQRRPAFLRQQPAVRRNGLCAMRQRHAARGMAERALRPAARAWPACRMRPPVISLVSAAACAPCHLARVHRRRLIRVALRRPHRVHRAQPSAAPPIAVGVSRLSGYSRRPRAVHADASRPPMRARRHRPSPNPSQPGPGPEPAESRPPVEPSAPIRAPPPAASRPAARAPLRFR